MVKWSRIQEIDRRGYMGGDGQGEGFVRPAEVRDCSRGRFEGPSRTIVRRWLGW